MKNFYIITYCVQTEQMKYRSSTKDASTIFLQEMSDTEDILYLTKKLRTACAQLSHQMVQKADYNFGWLSKLLSEINQNKYIQIPAIAIYYYCFRFLTDDDSSKYFLHLIYLVRYFSVKF